MVRLLIQFILIFGVLDGFGQQNPAELFTSIKSFNEAFSNADTATLSTLITKKYVHSNGSSGPYDRNQWLAYVQSRKAKMDQGNLEIQSYEMKDLRIMDYEKSAIVSATVEVKQIEDGLSSTKIFLVTHLWVQENQKWKRAAFHDGKIE